MRRVSRGASDDVHRAGPEARVQHLHQHELFGLGDPGCGWRRGDTADGQSLDQQIEKSSPTLGRTAVYTSYVLGREMFADDRKSRLSRLPAYLAVHMVSRGNAPRSKTGSILLATRHPVREIASLSLVPH